MSGESMGIAGKFEDELRNDQTGLDCLLFGSKVYLANLVSSLQAYGGKGGGKDAGLLPILFLAAL